MKKAIKTAIVERAQLFAATHPATNAAAYVITAFIAQNVLQIQVMLDGAWHTVVAIAQPTNITPAQAHRTFEDALLAAYGV